MHLSDRAPDLNYDSFVSLVDSLLGGGGFVVQIMHAFFDESGSHAESAVLCVTGYTFEKREARLMARDWAAVLKQYGLPFFHMVDCAHGNEAFADLTRSQRIKVETALIGIIKRRAAHGFAVSVDLEAYRDLMPAWGPTKSPYAFCARCIIDEIGRWFFKIRFRGNSAYFFEAGHASRSEADEVVQRVLTNPLTPLNGVHFGYVAHSFVLKRESPAVQAADLLAWQWATDVKHQMAGRSRRKDFDSLLQMPFRGCHFNRPRIVKYLDLLKEFGLDQKREQETMEEMIAHVKYVHGRALPAMFM